MCVCVCVRACMQKLMGSHSTCRREKKKQQLGGNAYISPKCLLSGREVRGETASSWLSFSSRSKIDSCIH